MSLFKHYFRQIGLLPYLIILSMNFYQQDFQDHRQLVKLNNVDILLGTLTYHLKYYWCIDQDMKNRIYGCSFEDGKVGCIMCNRLDRIMSLLVIIQVLWMIKIDASCN